MHPENWPVRVLPFSKIGVVGDEKRVSGMDYLYLKICKESLERLLSTGAEYGIDGVWHVFSVHHNWGGIVSHGWPAAN